VAKFRYPIATKLVWSKKAIEDLGKEGFASELWDVALFDAPKWRSKKVYEDRLLALVEVEVGVRPESAKLSWDEFEEEGVAPKSIYREWDMSKFDFVVGGE